MRRAWSIHAGGLAAAIGVGWFLFRQVPPDDAFRLLLGAAPLIAYFLVAIGKQIGRLPGGMWRTVIPVALTVLTARRGALGLDGLDVPLAVAWTAVLGLYVISLAPALRRTLGRRLTVHPPIVFLTLPLVVYLATATWSMTARAPDGDEPYYLLLAHSLAFDFDTDLANNYAEQHGKRFLDRPLEPQPGDPRGPDGAIFSRHDPLLPLMLAPFYALAGRAGAVLAMALAAAALSWMTLRLAARIAPDRPRGGFLAWALLAFTPPLVLYSQQIWVEVPAALALAVALDRLWALRAEGLRGLRGALALAAALAVLPLLKLRLGLLALPVLILAWLELRRRLDRRTSARMVVTATALLAVVTAGILARNQSRFGNPLKMHEWGDLAVFERPVEAFVVGGGGMFYDAAFGLFASAPIWLLILPAILIARRYRRDLVRDAALIGLPYLLAIAPRLEWYGGWSPPFRYPLVLLPVLALLLVPLLGTRRPGLKVVGGSLGLVTALLTLLWLAVPGWTYNLADGGNHLLDAGGIRVGADLTRFFPSMVRPRLATWAWPLASLLVVPVALARRPRRFGAMWGAAATWIAVAALLLVVHRVPTQTIELEDGFVRTRGGHLSPPPWTVARPRYRAGWTLRERSEARAPVVGSGPTDLRLAVRFIANAPEQPFFLELLADERLLLRWPATGDGVWQTLDVGTVDWPEGARLVLRGAAEHEPGQPHNGVIVDYVDFRWHDG